MLKHKYLEDKEKYISGMDLNKIQVKHAMNIINIYIQYLQSSEG